MRISRCTCVVRDCPTNCLSESEREQEKFFSFPKDDDRRNEWVMKLRREDLRGKSFSCMKNFVVCKLHFSEHHFRTADLRKLNTNASPNEVCGNRNAACKDEVRPCNEDISQPLQLPAVPSPLGSTNEGEYTVFALPTTVTNNETDNISAPPQVESVSDDHSGTHDNAELHTVELSDAICEAEDSPAAPEDPSEDSLLRPSFTLTHHVVTTQDLDQQPTQPEEIKVLNQITCNKQATIDPTQLCAVVPSAKRPANKIAAVLHGFTHPPVQVVQEECVEPEAKRICLEEPNVSTEAEVHLQDQHVTRLTKLRVAKVTTIKLITLTKD